MKKVLLTSAVALAAFGAVQAVSAENLVLKPGMVDPKTGKLVSAGTAGDATSYQDAFVNGKLDVNNLPAYSRFGTFDLRKASVTPVAEAKKQSAHYARVNITDANKKPLNSVEVDFMVNGVTFEVKTDEAGSAVITKTMVYDKSKNVLLDPKAEADKAKIAALSQNEKAEVEVPVNFPEGTVVKYRLVKSLATDGKDVEFVGEFKVSGDLYTNANIVVATRTDVTFQGQSAATQSTETPAKKAEWIKSGSRWWYKHADGSYTTNGWEKINGTWYYFDQAGWMVTGWVKDNGTWYYLDASGAMQTGWKYVSGHWYYLDASGAMQTGWKYVSGHWYYLNGSGALLVNTTTPDGYTVNGNGELV